MDETFRQRLSFASGLASVAISNKLADTPTSQIADAMRYAVSGGKGLRAFLVIEGAEICGLNPDSCGPAAGAIEAMHAYSLIHDDLPAMDDDDLRRGQPTVHKKWDEATAILAGDALQALSFGLLADQGEKSLQIDFLPEA